MSSRPVYQMCAQVVPSGEYLRGHGRVAVDVTALHRLWQHLPVLGLAIQACVPIYAVLRGSLLWLRFVNCSIKTIIIIIIIKPALSSSSVSFLSRSSTFSTLTLIMSTTCMHAITAHSQ